MSNKSVSYIRVSSEDQAKQFSLPSQRKELTSLAKSRQLRIVKIYDEGGISGESLSSRPQMLQLLEDAETGDFSYLLITALDRISRNLQDSIYIRSKLQDCGVTIITPSQEFSHDSIDHDFTANLFGSMADYERKRILERCQQGRIEKRNKGGWLGGIPPKGYKYNPANKTLEISKIEADEVNAVLQASIELSPYYASLELKKQGIKITPRQIRRMTEKKKILFYAGKLIDYSGNTIKADWQPIINNDIATQLLSGKQKRRTVGANSTKAKYLLTGLGIFKCRSCGRTIKSFSSGSKVTKLKWGYYRCSSIQYGEPCMNKKMWRIHIIDKAILSETEKTLKNIIDIESAYLKHHTKLQDSTAVKRLNNRLQTIQNKQNRLYDAVESGAIPMADVSNRFQVLKSEETEIRRQIESHHTNIIIPDFSTLTQTAKLFNFATDLTHEEKRNIITLIYNRIELGKKSIYYKSLLKTRSSDVRIQLR